MKPCHLTMLFLVLTIFMGCAALYHRHLRFTPKTVFDLRPGMTQKEIEARFGSPDRISVMTMGSKTSDPWQSLIYYYDLRKNRIEKNKHVVYTNTFYFVNDVQPPLLRSWELELVYPEKK